METLAWMGRVPWARRVMPDVAESFTHQVRHVRDWAGVVWSSLRTPLLCRQPDQRV